MRLIYSLIMWYRAISSFGSTSTRLAAELALQIEVDVAWYQMITLRINLMNISAVTIFLARVVLLVWTLKRSHRQKVPQTTVLWRFRFLTNATSYKLWQEARSVMMSSAPMIGLLSFSLERRVSINLRQRKRRNGQQHEFEHLGRIWRNVHVFDVIAEKQLKPLLLNGASHSSRKDLSASSTGDVKVVWAKWKSGISELTRKKSACRCIFLLPTKYVN